MKRSRQAVAVILNEDVEHLGFAGELVTVKPGYARNFLLTGNRGAIATPGLRKKREADMTKAAAKRETELKRLHELADKLAAEPIKATLNVGANDQIFGSVTGGEVIKKLKDLHDLEITPANLSGVPIKSLGLSQVSVKLGVGVTAHVPVEVSGKKQARATDDEPKEKKDEK